MNEILRNALWQRKYIKSDSEWKRYKWTTMTCRGERTNGECWKTWVGIWCFAGCFVMSPLSLFLSVGLIVFSNQIALITTEELCKERYATTLDSRNECYVLQLKQTTSSSSSGDIHPAIGPSLESYIFSYPDVFGLLVKYTKYLISFHSIREQWWWSCRFVLWYILLRVCYTYSKIVCWWFR